jgi:hypothetical protein
MILRRFQTISALLLLLVVCAWPARAADGATILFRKIFKSSYPEFVELKIGEDGKGTWDIRQLDEDASPQPFTVNLPLVQKIFGLAAELHNFEKLDLDVHRRIANLGQKTFRYEKDGVVHEVVFNYTLDKNANELLAIFESLSRQQGDLADLQRAMRYDRLGLNKVLVSVDGDVKNHVLPEPDILLPTLDEIASDERYMDLARQRARALAERIRQHR